MLSKRTLILGVCIFFCVILGNPYAPEILAQLNTEEISQQETSIIVNEAIMPFFLALQTGDVQGLERHIGGKLEETLGKLIRQNSDYSSFLRERYGNTHLSESIKIFQQKEEAGVQFNDLKNLTAIAPINSSLLGKRTLIIEIEKNTENVWKIIDQEVTD